MTAFGSSALCGLVLSSASYARSQLSIENYWCPAYACHTRPLMLFPCSVGLCYRSSVYLLSASYVRSELLFIYNHKCPAYAYFCHSLFVLLIVLLFIWDHFMVLLKSQFMICMFLQLWFFDMQHIRKYLDEILSLVYEYWLPLMLPRFHTVSPINANVQTSPVSYKFHFLVPALTIHLLNSSLM